jgi:hypothetical protein
MNVEPEVVERGPRGGKSSTERKQTERDIA